MLHNNFNCIPWHSYVIVVKADDLSEDEIILFHREMFLLLLATILLYICSGSDKTDRVFKSRLFGMVFKKLTKLGGSF